MKFEILLNLFIILFHNAYKLNFSNISLCNVVRFPKNLVHKNRFPKCAYFLWFVLYLQKYQSSDYSDDFEEVYIFSTADCIFCSRFISELSFGHIYLNLMCRVHNLLRDLNSKNVPIQRNTTKQEPAAILISYSQGFPKIPKTFLKRLHPV